MDCCPVSARTASATAEPSHSVQFVGGYVTHPAFVVEQHDPLALGYDTEVDRKVLLTERHAEEFHQQRRPVERGTPRGPARFVGPLCHSAQRRMHRVDQQAREIVVGSAMRVHGRDPETADRIDDGMAEQRQ
jgi:hypothetical protein